MRLDRYIGEAGGKYSIIENRKGGRVVHIEDPEDDFFVIKLKDANAQAALLAYAASAEGTDPELAEDVRRLAGHAGPSHPLCRKPD
jgi:hypothetical protein